MSISLIVIIVIVAVLAIAVVSIYNSLVSKRNHVQNTFSTIDVMLKKRFDLIPNLVATVKQYAEHESAIFEKVAASRASAMAGSTADKVGLANEMNAAQRSFFAIAEQYPDLKASENYRQLQGALNETEEQLSAARRTYNAAVTDFNTAIQVFPNNLLAGLMGFSTCSLLSIPEAEKENVNVSDLFNK